MKQDGEDLGPPLVPFLLLRPGARSMLLFLLLVLEPQSVGLVAVAVEVVGLALRITIIRLNR